jgi:hypothetical protein
MEERNCVQTTPATLTNAISDWLDAGEASTKEFFCINNVGEEFHVLLNPYSEEGRTWFVDRLNRRIHVEPFSLDDASFVEIPEGFCDDDLPTAPLSAKQESQQPPQPVLDRVPNGKPFFNLFNASDAHTMGIKVTYQKA